MEPPKTNPWKTDTEYIRLLNYVIERTANVGSPMNMRQLIRDFKEKCGATQTMPCLKNRIDILRSMIHNFPIDTNKKVKVLFALSGSVDANFLKEYI
ncbi:unnamed protein product [Caenorhabditis brenneri]